MYSVIIPTMWRSERTLPLIEALVNCKYVGEVIVIDNAPGFIPLFPTSPKLTFITNGQNNYVNPSWNMGVRLAKFDNIALCNDDITFNPDDVFKLDIGFGQLIGMHKDNYSTQPTPSIKKTHHREHGFGCLMLMRKSTFVPVPEEMRVSFGDDWLFNHAIETFTLQIPIATEMSTTSRDAEFIAIAEQDSHIWHTLNNNNS